MGIRFLDGKYRKQTNNFCFAVTINHPGKGAIELSLFSGLYANHHNGKKDIIIAKQKNFLKTTFILLHEFGHFLFDLFPAITHGEYDLLWGKVKKSLPYI